MNYSCECKGQQKIVALIMVRMWPVPNMKRRSDMGRQGEEEASHDLP
jgi:hypothetical protein